MNFSKHNTYLYALTRRTTPSIWLNDLFFSIAWLHSWRLHGQNERDRVSDWERQNRLFVLNGWLCMWQLKCERHHCEWEPSTRNFCLFWTLSQRRMNWFFFILLKSLNEFWKKFFSFKIRKEKNQKKFADDWTKSSISYTLTVQYSQLNWLNNFKPYKLSNRKNARDKIALNIKW